MLQETLYKFFTRLLQKTFIYFCNFCMVNEIKKKKKRKEIVVCVIDDIIHAFTNTRHMLCRLVIKITSR